jgi:GT2 family glycosyltransferase
MMGASLHAFVVIATRGRPGETLTLMDALARQTLPARHIVVVGADTSDLAGLDQHPLRQAGVADLVTSGRPGLTSQRNIGLDVLGGDLESTSAFVAFFDDDFRPAPDWLERCADAFATSPGLAGLTGRVLGDGVRGAGLTEEDAERLIDGRVAPLSHWSNVAAPREVASLYGCNMAFAATVCRTLRFDEALPLYGWQEDCDYTGQARRLGRTLVVPDCRGVHLGVKAGRQSGVKFGYSQIANPIHILRRRNMTPARAARFILRALAANAVRSVRTHSLFDYRGRLVGNLRAIIDLALGRCDPMRILSLP